MNVSIYNQSIQMMMKCRKYQHKKINMETKINVEMKIIMDINRMSMRMCREIRGNKHLSLLGRSWLKIMRWKIRGSLRRILASLYNVRKWGPKYLLPGIIWIRLIKLAKLVDLRISKLPGCRWILVKISNAHQKYTWLIVVQIAEIQNWKFEP